MADEVVKLVVIGESGAGKSWLIHSFLNKDLTPLQVTVGIEIYPSHLLIDDKNVRIHLWDTAGQERFRVMTRNFYRGAQAVALVYDVTKYQSFLNVDIWYEEAKQYILDSHTVMLIGNKIDLIENRNVPTVEGADYARKKGFFFIETSALKRINVENAFHQLMRETWIQRQSMDTAAAVDTSNVIIPSRDDGAGQSLVKKGFFSWRSRC